MEWQKAKNIVIIFLLLVNVTLFFLIVQENKKTRLSSEQEAAIFNVLSREGIGLYSDIMSLDFSPKRRMAFQEKSIDHDAVLNLFFNDIPTLSREEREGRVIYNNSSNKFLTIFGSSFVYDDYNDGELIDFSASLETLLKETRTLTDNFIAEMGNLAKGYELDIHHYKTGDFVNAVYRYNYRGTIIYPNEISFTISSAGIRSVEYTFMEPIGYDGDKRQIFSPDEALLRFMIDSFIDGLKPLIINNVDIVYFWSDDETYDDIVYAVPSYRINYTAEGRNRADFLIDAYTNEVR